MAKDSAAAVYSSTLAVSPFFCASSAMSTACLALPDTFSSSSMARSRRISVCFWLAITLAACSRSRRCWSWASVMACSSWIFGSALALKAEFTFAPRYFHHRLSALNMAASLTGVGRSRPGGAGEARSTSSRASVTPIVAVMPRYTAAPAPTTTTSASRRREVVGGRPGGRRPARPRRAAAIERPAGVVAELGDRSDAPLERTAEQAVLHPRRRRRAEGQADDARAAAVRRRASRTDVGQRREGEVADALHLADPTMAKRSSGNMSRAPMSAGQRHPQHRDAGDELRAVERVEAVLEEPRPGGAEQPEREGRRATYQTSRVSAGVELAPLRAARRR